MYCQCTVLYFKFAWLTYKLLTTGQPAYLRTLLHHYTPTRILLSTNQSFLDVLRRDFPLNLVKDRLVIWALAPTVWN